MIQYRTFRNYDSPGLAVIWNEAFSGRGGVRLRHSSPLENFVLAKPIFDPHGVQIALEDDVPVGFAHAAFGPTADQSALHKELGIICLVGVRPSHRRRGIGSELLRRCEAYLRENGATRTYAGGMAPLNPFYLGLYGGSNSPGFLASDAAAEPFMLRHGYQPDRSCVVMQRGLTSPVNVIDARFSSLRKLYEVRLIPQAAMHSWWTECTLGPIELVDFQLMDKSTQKVAGKASVWEMDLFSWRWSQPAVGVVDVLTEEDSRRQGLARYLLVHVLRYLQEHFFGIAEVQVPDTNQAALGLFKSLGFEQVDTGRSYTKVLSGASS